MSVNGKKYCGYCNQYRSEEGFKQVLHVASGTRRNICRGCQEVRRLPREQRDELVKLNKEKTKS